MIYLAAVRQHAETAVRINHALLMGRRAIGAGEEFVAKHAASVWDGKWAKVLTVEGVGRARPYMSSSKVTWDHEGLIKTTVTGYLADTGGDLSDPYDLIRYVTEAVSLDYWRVGVLEGRDVDVDDYRHKERGQVRLRITTDDQIGATARDGAA